MSSDAEQQRQHFGDLLLELEHDLGTRDTCVNFLESFKDALRLTAFKDADDVRRQIRAFYGMFADVKPRMAIIQNYLDDLLEGLLESKADTPEMLLDQLLTEIKEAEADNKERAKRLTKHALELIPQDAKVLVHSHSHTVLDTLCAAKRAHRAFTVVVAEQEGEHTLDVIHTLQKANVPFTVVPEYMLSYIEEDIDCMLIGAVTLKADFVLAADAGTKAVVSEMNAAGIPVHLLITTNKFSFWKTRSAPQTIKTVKSLHHHRGGFEYDRVKFSHDRMPLDQVTSVATEEGRFTVAAMKKRFEELLDEYEEQVRELDCPPMKRKAPKRRLKGE